MNPDFTAEDFYVPTMEERINPSSKYYCAYCNYNRHVCPGCGEWLSHEVDVCDQCIKDHNL